jgi:hypothetical protein
MSKAINWRRAALWDKHTISIKDEEDRRANDAAARWLARNGWRKAKRGRHKALDFNAGLIHGGFNV